MNERTAQALFAKWVKILGLQDWEIRFHWKVRSYDMAAQDSRGVATYNMVKKQASIQMLDQQDDEEWEGFKFDYEKTLVHELMHLKLAVIDVDQDDEHKDPVHEHVVHQMVDEFAKIMVNLDRRQN